MKVRQPARATARVATAPGGGGARVLFSFVCVCVCTLCRVYVWGGAWPWAREKCAEPQRSETSPYVCPKAGGA